MAGSKAKAVARAASVAAGEVGGGREEVEVEVVEVDVDVVEEEFDFAIVDLELREGAALGEKRWRPPICMREHRAIGAASARGARARMACRV